MDCSLPGSSVHGDSSGQNTGVGCHLLLQEVSLTPCLSCFCFHLRGCPSHSPLPVKLSPVASCARGVTSALQLPAALDQHLALWNGEFPLCTQDPLNLKLHPRREEVGDREAGVAPAPRVPCYKVFKFHHWEWGRGRDPKVMGTSVVEKTWSQSPRLLLRSYHGWSCGQEAGVVCDALMLLPGSLGLWAQLPYLEARIKRTSSTIHLVLLPALWYTHLYLYRLMEFSGILVCWAEAPLMFCWL